MGTIKNSSDSETVLLEILWNEDKPLSVSQMMERLEERQIKWAYTTVGTFLKRMEKKGLVSSVKEGRSYYYRAEVKKGEITTGPAKYIDKYFKGSLNEFLAAFTRERSLTKDEIRELKELTDSLDERDK